MARGKAWKTDLNPRVKDIVSGAAERGLFLTAEHVLGEANKKVPHEEGTLENSGTVSVDPRELRAAVSYNTPYAVKQHEVDMRHNDGRTHKWLENAMNAEKDTARDIIVKALRKEL